MLNGAAHPTVGRSLIGLFVVMLLLVAQAGVGAFPARAASFTVDSVGDEDDADLGDGGCRTADGVCTLRAAIQQANVQAGPDTIQFNLSDSTLIEPGSALPDIADDLTIDGTTQPGYSGTPLVVIDGSSAGSVDGLRVTAGDSSILGLEIRDFAGNGVLVLSGSNGSIVANEIFGNGDLGINLQPSGEAANTATPNDRQDRDNDSPNRLLNYPDVAWAVETDGEVTFSIHLDVDFDAFAVPAWYRVDVFKNPGGGSQGQVFVTSDVLFDPGTSAGGVSGEITFTGVVGDIITATTSHCTSSACTSFDRTSEFSPAAGVIQGNRAPVLDPITDPFGDEETLIQFTASASDPDGNDLTYSLSGAPPGAMIGSSSGVFAWTPTEAQGLGTYTFDVVVTDDGWPPSPQSTSQEITVTVHEVNSPPVLAFIPDQSVDELTTISFTAPATDIDVPANSLSFSLDGAPAGASISSGGAFAWAPSEAQGPGVYTFDVEVFDGITADSQEVTVTVYEVNSPPVLAFIPDQSVDELTTISFTATATDIDVPADSIGFLLSGEPDGASISSGGVFAWAPSEAQGPGVYTFDVEVFDGITADSQEVTVTVYEVNTLPVLASIGDQTVDERVELSFTISATDTDVPASSLTFSLSAGAPAGASIDAATGAFSWTPREADGGLDHAFDVIVADGVASVSETVVVSVLETNEAPTLATIGNQSIDEHVPLLFMAAGSDSDIPADTLTYSLKGHPPGATIDPVTGAFRWAPAESEGPGSYTFDVAVTDGDLEARETINVTVNEVNLPQVLASIGNQTVDEMSTLSFVASATDPDSPPNTLTYSLEGAPPGASIGSTDGAFFWTPTEIQGPGSFSFDVVVTDDGSPAIASREPITVTVNEVNLDPTVISPGNLTGNEGEEINVAIGAWDADIPLQALTWSAVGLPSGLSIDPASGGITGTLARPGNVPTPHAVTVSVADGSGGESSVGFTWTVVPTNLNPTAAHDHFSVDELGTIISPAPGVLGNDSDVEPGALSAALLVPPSRGLVDLKADGSFTYTHTDDDDTDDSFSYILTDAGAAVDIGVVSIEVIKVNDLPIAGLDIVQTAEDTPISFSPLGNDSDPDGDAVTISGIAQPGSGALGWSGDAALLFTPAKDFFGTTTATYTITDGRGGTDTGTVRFVVSPVNDAPLGAPDRYELSNYLPISLTVLSNDIDPDGDPLEIRWIGDVEVGSVDVDGDTIIYTPLAEWSGATVFTYTIADPGGAIDVVEVSITVRPATRRAAMSLLDDLENGAISLAGISPGIQEAAPLSLDPVKSVSLTVNAFYQTISAFRLPLVFLGLSLAVLVGLGGVTKAPLLLIGRTRTHWSVVLLDRESALQVHLHPENASEVVYNFNPTTESVLSTGKIIEDGDTVWMRVHTPRGDGWVDSFHLTEQVDVAEFYEDQRAPKLLREFAEELRNGGDVTPLISERGIVLALTGPPTRLAPRQFAELLGGSRLRRLPTIGGVLHAQDDFRIAVADPFLAAFDATREITAETAHSQAALIPAEVWNFRYLALGEESSQPWLVFFEFKQGKPRIVGIGIDE
jgi:CSLREA domain-containing protein